MLKIEKRNILIRRTFAVGDIICTEPISRYYASNGFNVYFDAAHLFEVYENNPNVKRAPGENISQTIDLNGTYERRLDRPIVDGYLTHLRITLPEEEKIPNMYIKEEENNWAKSITNNKKYIVMDIGYPGAAQRRGFWYPKFWEKTIKIIKSHGFMIVQTGWKQGFSNFTPGVINLDLRGGTSLRQVFSLVNNSCAYVGMDNGISHSAIALKKPSAAIFNPRHPYHNLVSKAVNTVSYTHAAFNEPFPEQKLIECFYRLNEKFHIF